MHPLVRRTSRHLGPLGALVLPVVPALALVVGAFVTSCTPNIGDKCSVSTDCSSLGDRLCDTTQPDGYCTTFNCEPDSCTNAICVAFNQTLDPACGAATSGQWPRFERTFCLAQCSDTSDCRDQYQCVDLQSTAAQIKYRAQVIDTLAPTVLGYSVCMAATCADDIQDAHETDVDCGGDQCAGCPDKEKCGSGSDCLSSICVQNHCVEQTCTDGSKDDLETDVDCGGTQCLPCTAGKKCLAGSDCASGVCGTASASGICGPGDCHDGMKDGSETDVDCGGGCTPCLVTQACVVNADCATSNCKDGLCIAAPIPEVCLQPDAGPFMGDAGPSVYVGGWTGPDAGSDGG